MVSKPGPNSAPGKSIRGEVAKSIATGTAVGAVEENSDESMLHRFALHHTSAAALLGRTGRHYQTRSNRNTVGTGTGRDGNEIMPPTACAALSRIPDGDGRRVTDGDTTGPPPLMCTFTRTVAIGARRQLDRDENEDEDAGQQRRDVQLPVMPPSMSKIMGKYYGASMITTSVHVEEGWGARHVRPHVVESAGMPALLPVSRDDVPVPGQDEGPMTVLASRWYWPGHLAHWLINGYLPALDHWLNMGAPKPLTLAMLGGEKAWSPNPANTGYTARGVWPADGFGAHSVLLLGHSEWPVGLPAVEPTDPKQSKSLGTGEQEPLVRELIVARELAVIKDGDSASFCRDGEKGGLGKGGSVGGVGERS